MKSKSSRPRHVLLVTADHWPRPLLGCAGHPILQTPTLDALARSGTRFANAYTECPVCISARRTLMTGTAARVHGDRSFREELTMPALPTLAGAFRDAGYQAFAAGKLHVFPQRNRIGFDDVALAEEGRVQFGLVDDYEDFLTREGFPGMVHSHGLSVNGYEARSWALPEHCHVTNWITSRMISFIKRRDPTRPAFWYLSYTHPHPPLAPLPEYLRLYEQTPIPPPPMGDWARDETWMPGLLVSSRHRHVVPAGLPMEQALRSFYALCTHIDHQLRLVLGTLREEKLLNDTVILFASDHGDLLGSHGFWAKRLLYEYSAGVPMILVGPSDETRVPVNHVDRRLAGLQDVMPTLLDLAGVSIPRTVTGRSLVQWGERSHLYGEYGEGIDATRMIRHGRWKLIYYSEGNRFQLFDLEADPGELVDLAGDSRHHETLEQLRDLLRGEIYGDDMAWIRGKTWRGLPLRNQGEILTELWRRSRELGNQRGSHWPPVTRIV